MKNEISTPKYFFFFCDDVLFFKSDKSLVQLVSARLQYCPLRNTEICITVCVQYWSMLVCRHVAWNKDNKTNVNSDKIGHRSVLKYFNIIILLFHRAIVIKTEFCTLWIKYNDIFSWICGLSFVLSLIDLYNDYVDECKKTSKAYYGTLSLYWHFFNYVFNMSFHIPRNDQCLQCNTYKNLDDTEKLELEQVYSNHIEEKELCRVEKTNDKNKINDLFISGCLFWFASCSPIS